MTVVLTDAMKAKLKHYRLSLEEFDSATRLLGRDLKEIEWPLFSALWSEHCSYKSSKVHLRKFYNQFSESRQAQHIRVLESEGENAGVIDLGEGERIAFKMESHNHPSFIEPYQGAATGVGGILRDIFTMGARPIAIADYLCFGDPKALRMEALVNGVVKGIGGYGNCVGVPTVTGQTTFHGSYNGNILVNAMAVGLFRKGEKIALSKAKGNGNLVMYVGAKTGKDGVHGAAMASESFDQELDKKKPNVQIGDPYFEKLLIESCLEVIQADLVVAIQDMGAAGLTSSSFEMASKGQVGMDLNLDQVPLRDMSMTPEEILLSESQERMLMVVEPSKQKQIEQVFERWGLDATVVGSINTTRKIRLFWRGEVLTEVDPDIFVERAPQYKRPFAPWVDQNKIDKFNSEEKKIDFRGDIRGATTDQMSRNFIFRQYDQRVGAMTVRDCHYSVALQRLPDSGRGLAISVGCRPEIMRMDARLGALDSVAFPALKMACLGAEALAITDCLNFGNPEKLNVMSEFVASVDAISAMAKSLDAPVVSGNVSFYNETLGQNIISTPAIGMLGLRPNIEGLKAEHFVSAGEKVFLLQLPLVKMQNLFSDHPVWTGEFDIASVTAFIHLVREISFWPEVSTMRAVSLGGILPTLIKMGVAGMGLSVMDPKFAGSGTEAFYQVIVSGNAELKSRFEKMAEGLVKDKRTTLKMLEWNFIGETQKEWLQWGGHQESVIVIQKENQKTWGRTFENLA